MEMKASISKVIETKPNFFLISDELLPSRSHKLVKGRVDGALAKTDHCIIDPSYASKRYGLILPSYIVPTEREISFLIHNCLQHALRLRKGATMGRRTSARSPPTG